MSNPYLANAAVADWQSVQNLLLQVIAGAGSPSWAILESLFEIKLSYATTTQPTEIVKPSTGQVQRGRVFWKGGEVRFRYDGSLPQNPYRLVLISEVDASSKLESFTTQVVSGTPWERVEFQHILWGEPLKEERAKEEWFVTRIPTRLKYSGITWAEKHLAVVCGYEYKLNGETRYYRFSHLDTIKDNRNA